MLRHANLDPAVLGFSFLARVVVDRPLVAPAARHQVLGIHALAFQITDDRQRPFRGQLPIVRPPAPLDDVRIRVAKHVNVTARVLGLDLRRQTIERGPAFRLELDPPRRKWIRQNPSLQGRQLCVEGARLEGTSPFAGRRARVLHQLPQVLVAALRHRQIVLAQVAFALQADAFRPQPLRLGREGAVLVLQHGNAFGRLSGAAGPEENASEQTRYPQRSHGVSHVGSSICD